LEAVRRITMAAISGLRQPWGLSSKRINNHVLQR
jgi:hypothetical protein